MTTTKTTTRASGFSLAYAAVCYAGFHAVFGYLVLFVNDIVVPTTVTGEQRFGTAAAVAINLGLIVLWGLQQSVMARRSFKERWTKIVPKHAERATYVLATVIALSTVMFGWASVDGTVWFVANPAVATLLTGIGAAGWLLIVAASFEIDHFELFGLKQAYVAWRGREMPEYRFQAKYIYRVVRHPIQTGLLIGMWCTPNMSASRAMFAGLMTAYIMVGLYFEERDLVRQFGARYLRYRQEVPKVIPVPGRGASDQTRTVDASA